jgi:hypothetical protein
MEIAKEPEVYAPRINDMGIYEDYVPKPTVFVSGICCPCGARYGKVYKSHISFKVHFISRPHVKWIAKLNDERAYLLCNQLRELVQRQRVVIAELNQKCDDRACTIADLNKKCSERDAIIASLTAELNSCAKRASPAKAKPVVKRRPPAPANPYDLINLDTLI